MRIGIVSPYALDPPGGVQQYACELAERLLAEGHDPFLVAPGRRLPPDPGSQIPVRTVGRAWPVRANGSVAHICLDPRAIGRTRRALADADVVHVHEPLMPLIGLAASRAGRPCVTTFHADPSPAIRWLYRAARSLIRGISGQAGVGVNRIVTAVSPSAAEAVQPLAGDVPIVTNAVDVATYRPAGVDKIGRRVAFLGRDDRRKGLSVLLDAWPAVVAAVPDATLDVLGATRDPVDGVRFLGRVSEEEKRRHLAEAQVFCAPNLGGESFGITLVEGMAAGCHVVASDLAAFRWVGGDVATFATVGDPDALAAAIIEALTSPDPAGVAAASIERAATYDWSMVLPAYLDLYREAAGS